MVTLLSFEVFNPLQVEQCLPLKSLNFLPYFYFFLSIVGEFDKSLEGMNFSTYCEEFFLQLLKMIFHDYFFFNKKVFPAFVEKHPKYIY